MEITKKDLKNWKDEIKRYNDVLYEKFRNDIGIIGEGWGITDGKVDKLATKLNETDKKVDKLATKLNETDGKVDKLATKLDETDGKVDKLDIKVDNLTKDFKITNEKLDATIEIVGETKEDVEIIKTDISFIKNALKQKADKDELEALEKRVLFLENKFKRV